MSFSRDFNELENRSLGKKGRISLPLRRCHCFGYEKPCKYAREREAHSVISVFGKFFISIAYSCYISLSC